MTSPSPSTSLSTVNSSPERQNELSGLIGLLEAQIQSAQTPGVFQITLDSADTLLSGVDGYTPTDPNLFRNAEDDMPNSVRGPAKLQAVKARAAEVLAFARTALESEQAPVLENLSVVAVDEAERARENRVLNDLKAKYTEKLDGHENEHDPILTEARNGFMDEHNTRQPLSTERVAQIFSARNVITGELIGKLKSILNGISDEDERDKMLDWIEDNLIHTNWSGSGSIMQMKEAGDYDTTGKLSWPIDVKAKPAANGVCPLNTLPQTYWEVISACIKATIARNVIQHSLDYSTNYRLLLSRAIDNKNPEEIDLSLNEDDFIIYRRRQYARDEKIQTEEELDPSLVAQMALALDGIKKEDDQIDWGELKWPKSITLKNKRLRIGRTAEKELKVLREKAGEERIRSLTGTRDEFASRVGAVLDNKGGEIPVASVIEAKRAVEILTEKARAVVEEAKGKVSTAQSEAGRADVARLAAEGQLTKAQAAAKTSADTVTTLEIQLTEALESKKALETAAKTKQAAMAAAYQTLQTEIAAAEKAGFGRKDAARLAAYGKHLAAIQSLNN